VGARFLLSLFRRSFLIIALVAAAAVPVSAQEPPRRPPPAGRFAAGRILVKFKPGVGGLSAQRTLTAQSLSVAGSVPSLDVLKVSVKPGQELAEVAALRGDPNVLYAEPDYIALAQTIPNDPYYASQWGLSKIDAPTAWDLTTGSSAVVIAIVDTGIDLDHEDFSCAGKLTSARWNFVADNSNPDDDYGHGTHVAGIAAACSNNGKGVAGVAWGARLMPVKVLDASGSGYYSDVAAGITYAVDHGARIVNLSLGGTSGSTTLATAVQYAHDHGVLVVAAAGNCAQDGPQCNYLDNPIIYPAAYPTVLAVAATNSNDNWADFSEHQPYVDVAAPGVDIYSTYFDGGYTFMNGTSMAAPHVSGLAALLWSLVPSLTVDQVESIIESTADDLVDYPGAPGKDDYFGYGRINAGRALSSVGLQVSPAQTLILIGDNGGPAPASPMGQVTTLSPEPITWTATISPSVSWLSLAPPASGMVSASSSPPAAFTLVATRPITYGTYTTTVIVTATTSGGGLIGPASIQIDIDYLATLYIYHFPLMYKNGRTVP
jgi:subtilisin family serine protease